MGEVYRARNTKLDRDVALRVLRQDLECHVPVVPYSPSFNGFSRLARHTTLRVFFQQNLTLPKECPKRADRRTTATPR